MLNLYILFELHLCHFRRFGVLALCTSGMHYVMNTLEYQTCNVEVGLLYLVYIWVGHPYNIIFGIAIMYLPSFQMPGRKYGTA